MLRVVTGPFHPDLESALVDQIRRTKSRDPLASIGLFVPSSSLLDRLRRLLAVDHGLSLLNVHLLTFHQLALRLAEERRRFSGTASRLDVADSLFFEQLVRHLVRRLPSSFSAFREMGHASGTWGALWATLRDLKDAAVDAGEAVRAIDEGCFEEADVEGLRALYTLYAAVTEACRTLRVGTPDDLAASLVSYAPESEFLSSLQETLYYGFYDLTQVQLSLLEAVADRVPATLLFPLGDHPSERFARRFFERYVLPLAGHVEAAAPAGPGEAERGKGFARSAPVLEVSVRSVVGAKEELASACRQILDLVETNGYRFDEIGVVSRTLDPYVADLSSVFDRYRIPVTSTVGRPLIHEPLCKWVLQLASIPVNDGYRACVLDIVTSPLFRMAGGAKDSDRVRPDLWKVLVPALQITRGRDEWARLEQAGRSGLSIDETDDDAHSANGLQIPAEVIRCLWDQVSRLLDDCAALPKEGTPAVLVDALEAITRRHVMSFEEGECGRGHGASELARVWDSLQGVFASLSRLDALGETMSWADFLNVLTHAVERASIPSSPSGHSGVAVVDVMDLRGLTFKALFVLGLNEKVFPRYIREDPFLRDRHRRVLESTLGFKIDEKLGAYDEEDLLFLLACRAATRRLILSYQRADEEGRSLAASPYLAEAGRYLGHEELPVESVPRRLTDRMRQRPAMRRLLPPGDLAVWMAMNGEDPAPLLESVDQDPGLFRQGAAVLARLEDERPALSGFDGKTGPLDSFWAALLRRGPSPTSLERYARCPFQYYASDVLRVEPLCRSVDHEVDALVVGTLCHAALRRCYEELIQRGWPRDLVSGESLTPCIARAVEAAAIECEGRHQTGHYLLWEMAKEQVRHLIEAAVEEDRRAFAEDGFAPFAFEVEAEGLLPRLGETDDLQVKIRGRVDRLDRQGDLGPIRVVDYKFRTGIGMKTDDRRLVQAAVRGHRLQPPLYTRLVLLDSASPSQMQLFFLAPKWSPPIARSTFDATVWSSAAGERIRRTLRVLLDGVRAGRYPMLPDEYCDACSVRAACRRDHTPSWWRVSRTPEVAALRSLRKERIQDE